MNTLSDYLKSINQTKKNIFVDDGSYNQFVINLCLSRVFNSFPIIDALNRMTISDSMHYRFLLEILPVGNRYGETFKKEKDENLKNVVEYYQCSDKRGKEILSLLNHEQVEEIKRVLTGRQ